MYFNLVLRPIILPGRKAVKHLFLSEGNCMNAGPGLCGVHSGVSSLALPEDPSVGCAIKILNDLSNVPRVKGI